MKDLRVIAKVVNNQMRERREALDLTGSEVARRAGIHPTLYSQYENLKKSPLDTRRCRLGKWNPTALKIAKVLDAEPAVLWPERVRNVRARIVERRLDAEELHALACPPPDQSPFGLLVAGEEAAAVRSAVEALPDQQRKVLTARFGLDGEEPKLLDEVAEDLGVTRSRVQQIEQRALWELRQKGGTDAT